MAKWPGCQEEMIDENLEETLRRVQDVVTSIRNIRSEMNVPPVKKADVLIKVDSKNLQKTLEDNQDHIKNLGRVGDLKIGIRITKPDHAASAVIKGAEIFVPLEGLKIGVQLVDALTSPSKVICRDWGELNTGVWVPNFPQGKWYEDLPGKPEELDDRVVIGWGGSVSHYDSFWFSGVRQALESLCARRPEVLFKFCGNDGRVYFQLPVGVRQKAWQQGVPPPDWPKVVSTFDIGLAPLDLTGPYDARRSWIKGVEYMLARVPWVGSDGPPYEDLREWGHLTENTPEAWEERLEYLIDHLDEERERAAGDAYEKGLGLTMENNVGFYANLVQKMRGLRQSAAGLPGVIQVGPIEPPKKVTELEGVIHVE